jgi:hypothetical protein
MRKSKTRTLFAVAAIDALALVSGQARAFTFTPGDIVIDTVAGSTLDSASPMTLQQFTLGANGTSATAAGTLVLLQTNLGANSAISGEYRSASEGILQQSANGQFLTMMGYGVNAATFNSASPSTYGTAALANHQFDAGRSNERTLSEFLLRDHRHAYGYDDSTGRR